MKIVKNVGLFLLAVTVGLVCVSASRAQSPGVNFTQFKFFSTKDDFDWDKVVYATQFDPAELHQMQVLIEFENPSSKPFKVEVKVFRDGQLVRTEQSEELVESGGLNKASFGDNEHPGTVPAGNYRAELWYQGQKVKTAEAAVSEKPGGGGSKWLTMSDVKLTMMAPAGWDTHEQNDAMVAVNPNGQVRINAYLSERKTLDEAREDLQRTFESWCNELKLGEDLLPDEINGLTVMSLGGTGRAKDGEGQIDLWLDLIERNGRIVVVVTYGPHDALVANLNNYLATVGSIKAIN